MKELDRNDTKMLQALSVLAMVCLHLFCTLDYAGLYKPLLFIQGIPLCYYLAQISDFCVFGFAFCSGYGHFARCGEKGFYKKRLKGLLSVFVCYWLILMIYVIIGVCMGQSDKVPGSFLTFIGNFLSYDPSYNGAWWYMFTYAVIVAASPLLLKFIKRVHPVIISASILAVYLVGFFVRFYVDPDKISVLSTQPLKWFVKTSGPFLMTVAEYAFGALCFRLQLISKIYGQWSKLHIAVRISAAAVLLCGAIYVHGSIFQNVIIAPFTGFMIILLFHFWKKPKFIQKALLIIGDHSTNIWLSHMFFYAGSALFAHLVYTAEYPPLIYLFMIAITLSLSVILTLIEKPIIKFIK